VASVLAFGRRKVRLVIAAVLLLGSLQAASEVALACSIGSLNASQSGSDVNIQATGACSGGVRAMRILVDGNIIYEIGAPSLNATWHANGQTGSHTITALAAALGDNNWSNPASQSINYLLNSAVSSGQPQAPYSPQYEGALVKGSPDPVWLLQGGQRHWVPNPDTMHSLQLSGHAYYSFSDSDINRIPQGSDVTAVPPPPPSPNPPAGSTSSGSSGSAVQASGSCRDPWVTQAIQQVVGRAPQGSGDTGECDYHRYGGGSWTTYNDLVQKVSAAFGQQGSPQQPQQSQAQSASQPSQQQPSPTGQQAGWQPQQGAGQSGAAVQWAQRLQSIQQAYVSVLGRPADQGGLNSFATSNLTLDQINSALLSSGECHQGLGGQCQQLYGQQAAQTQPQYSAPQPNQANPSTNQTITVVPPGNLQNTVDWGNNVANFLGNASNALSNVTQLLEGR